MSYKVNYENLHLSELEDALKNINEESHPDEAEYIRNLISKGGYKYPEKINIESAEITNNYFKWVLIVIISIFLAINTFNFISYLYPLSLIPMLIQSSILYMIVSKNKYLRTGVMLWSFLLIISGIFGLLSMNMSLDVINTYKLIDKSFNLIAGLLFFWLSGKFIISNEKASNKKVKIVR